MDDFDIKEFAKMFDAALASDNPSVKKALRNFLLVVAIVDAENDNKVQSAGPLTKIVEEVTHLKNAVAALQTEMSANRYNRTSIYPNTGIYPNTSTTSVPNTWIQRGINTVSVGSTGSATSYASAIRNHVQSEITKTDILNDYFRDSLLDVNSNVTTGTNNGNQSN